MTIYMGKSQRPYFYIFGIMSQSILLWIFCIFFASSPSVEDILKVTAFFGTMLFVSWVLLRMLAWTCMGKLTVNEEGIRRTCIFYRPMMYTWKEIASCGLDFRRFNLMYSTYIYIAKEHVLPLDYDFRNYPIRSHASDFNIYWNKFLRKHKAYWSIKKQSNLFMMIEANDETIQQFKTFLPKRLLKQLEDSEKRLYQIHPSFKK